MGGASGGDPDRRLRGRACHGPAAKRRHSSGTPLSAWLPRSAKTIPEPATRSTTVRDTRTSLAWAEPALFPEEVRNYVRRARKILAELAIPCDLVNRPNRGYSLVFRDDR